MKKKKKITNPVIVIDYLPLKYDFVINNLKSNSSTTTQYIEERGQVGEKPDTARSYRTAILDDNAIVSINLKWLGQICVLIGILVYGYWQIETRIKNLENSIVIANEQIGDLLSKHIMEERAERQELADKVAFYEKEFNINPLSWGKKKRGKKQWIFQLYMAKQE